jgi:predicted site-specific integrase-resolvase
MKLSVWAKKQGVSYKTAWRLWKSGKLDAYQLPTGTVIVRENENDGLKMELKDDTREDATVS